MLNMKRTSLILLLLTIATATAMGQSLQDQKACYAQAQKVANKGPFIQVSNHYDARSKTCWVKEFKQTNKAIDESVYNAFEPNTWESEFAGIADGPWLCYVHDVKCSNIAEFERLVKQRYGF